MGKTKQFMSSLIEIDKLLFRIINSSGFEELDCVMILISSKLFWIPLYLYIIFLIYKYFPQQFFKILISIILLIFISDYGSVELFKNMFERERPCHIFKSPEDIRIVDGCGGKYGFISSHASNSFSIAFFLALLFRNFKGFVFLFSWATLIGFSRIYLGVHYPFDILGGMFWGLFVSLLVYLTYNMKIKKIDKIWILWVSLVCIWNFGWSKAPALADIIIAILLSIFVIKLKQKTTK